MAIALMLLLCTGASVASLRWPITGAIVPFGLAVFIPQTATEDLFGGIPLHPAAFVTGAIFITHLIFSRNKFGPLVSSLPYVYIILGLVVTATLLYTAPDNPTAVALVLNMVTAPVCLFIYTAAVLKDSPLNTLQFRNWIIGFALSQVFISLAAKVVGHPLFFSQSYAKQYWYEDLLAGGRSLGTLDHALMMALFLTSVVPLLASLKSLWLRAALAAVLLVGVLLTQSRAGLALALVGVAFLIVRSIKTLRQGVWLTGGAVALATIVLLSGVASPVLARIVRGFSSGDARGGAVSTFLDILPRYLFFGSQTGNSYGVAAAEGMKTSFENPFFMYTVDYGLPVALAYFALLAALTVLAFRRKGMAGAAVSLVVAFVMIQSSSSLAVNGFSGYFIWGLAALGITALPSTQYERPQQSDSST